MGGLVCDCEAHAIQLKMLCLCNLSFVSLSKSASKLNSPYLLVTYLYVQHHVFFTSKYINEHILRGLFVIQQMKDREHMLKY